MPTPKPLPQLALLAAFALLAAAPTKPVTTTGDGPGRLVVKWFNDGTAAGNDGDWYDNRDRGHSELNLAPYPQVQKVPYSKEELEQRRDWAAANIVRPYVCFGNSSTSAGVAAGGSNVRMYYSQERALGFLYAQYTHNNLYMYPEHLDHDPGHNGLHGGGYGDVYPTNTPFLITSQGSSGTDHPFMKAMPHVLAAFRPDVKKKLVETGLLMPTVQMCLRRTYKTVKEESDYLTGKAHPTVFEGSLLNHEGMVTLAHDITLGTIPPMVQMKVIEQEQMTNGKDFFEARGDEKLADTPVVIARVFRGLKQTRRMIISAEGSQDLNKKPLKYHWVLLRGDDKRVTIKPTNESGSVAEITVAYQERRPISPGNPLESNRVDIGVFVHNGSYYSAPGFVTWFFLDHEARVYDPKGNILEVGYGLGETDVSITNWKSFFDALKAKELSVGMQIFQGTLTKADWEGLLKVADEYLPAEARLAEALEQQKTAQSPTQKTAANTAVDRARKFADDVLDQKRDSLSTREKIDTTLRSMTTNPSFYEMNLEKIAPLLKQEHPRVLLRDASAALQATSFLKSAEPLELQNLKPNPTPYELSALQHFNNEVLSKVLFEGIVRSDHRINFVDPNISPPKQWRDTYRYDDAGTLKGWTRFESNKSTDFTPAGQAIERDAKGEITRARAVKYLQDPMKSGQFGANWNSVKWTLEN